MSAARADGAGVARITPYRDGPLLVRGPFRLVDQDGNEIDVHQDTIALCRCGRSARKPFCDGTHKAAGWRAASGPQASTPERPNVEPEQRAAAHPVGMIKRWLSSPASGS